MDTTKIEEGDFIRARNTTYTGIVLASGYIGRRNCPVWKVMGPGGIEGVIVKRDAELICKGEEEDNGR